MTDDGNEHELDNLSHSQMLSILLNLLGWGSSSQTILADYGYWLLRLELSLDTQSDGTFVQPDMVVVCDAPEALNIVEVKSGPEISTRQIERYMDTSLVRIVQLTGYSIRAADMPFFGLWALGHIEAMAAIGQYINAYPKVRGDGPVSSRIAVNRVGLRHLEGDIGNASLQGVLSSGYTFDINDLDLALLPPDTSTIEWKFSDFVFICMVAVWRRTGTEFTLDDVFEEGYSPFFDVLGPDNRRAIRGRMQAVLKRMRAVALKGIMVSSLKGGAGETAWRITRKRTPQTERTLLSRHAQFVEMLRRGIEPKPSDFSEEGYEQWVLFDEPSSE